jgi:hypothetical protein
MRRLRRSTVRYRVPRRHVGSTDQGFSALLGAAPPGATGATLWDPDGPALLADHVADGTDTVGLEATAIRLGPVLQIVPAIPGAARARKRSGPGWQVASDWYVGRPVLIVAEQLPKGRSR